MNQKNLIQKIKEIKALLEECLIELSGESTITNKDSLQGVTKSSVDFEIPIRPFIKHYAKRLSGSKKFVLLLAWMTKGDEKKEISLSQIRAQWDKMKSSSLLGFKFNRFYPAEAQENNWVENTGKGMYKLRPNWSIVLNSSKVMTKNKKINQI